MQSEISQAEKKSGMIIVMFHWGNEYTEKITSRQSELAHLAIDAGADLVIGSHPHWIQSTETYKGKQIDYSLGNFIFDQYWSDKTKQGSIAKYTFLNHQLIHTSRISVETQTNGHTVVKTLQ